MKKYIIGIFFMLLLTGCSNIYDTDYDTLIDGTLQEANVKENTFLEGYKLYLPNHMTLIGDTDSNNILYSYGDKYYLYVDLISYYNKRQNEYKIKHEKYEYSKDIDFNDKKGYVVVSKTKGGNLVEIMYNYAKIEVVTNDVKRAISSSLVVLKNISYNYKIIDSMIGSNALVYDSELFTLMGPEDNDTDNFLTYEEEYGVYEEDEEKTVDENVIEMESVD